MPAHPELEVHTDAVRLARAAKGSLIILVPDPEQATWLNLERPIFANRALRVILFSTAETSSLLARRAPDFFSWISHRIECPEGPPVHAVRGIHAALRTRARGIAWAGGDFEAAFNAALPGRSLVRASAAMPYEQMVETAKPSGKSWVAWSDVDGPFRLRRVRWAVAEAGRRGRTVLLEPTVDAPEFLRVDGRMLDIKKACAELEEAGAKHAGRLAALLDLDPEVVRFTSLLLEAGRKEESLEAAAWTAADASDVIAQLSDERGIGATTASKQSSPVESLLLSRDTNGINWIDAARAALDEDEAEVASFWAKRALFFSGDDREALKIAGQALDRLGAHVEAETLLRKAIAIDEIAGKIDHVHADTLIDLARVLLNQGRLADAEKLTRKAITTEKRTAGLAHSGYATAIRGLAIVLRERGRYEEAEQSLRESAIITKRIEGKKHPNYAVTISDLATVLVATGKRGAAEALFRESLAIIDKTLGTENSEYANTVHGLGRCLLEQHRYSEAETYLRTALSIREKILGPYHPYYATSLHELARCLTGQGAYAEAERNLRRALSIFGLAIGVNSPSYSASLHELAGVLLHRGNYSDAEQMFRAVLAIEQEIFGKEHPALCATLCDLGFTLASQGQFTAGEELVTRSIAIARNFGSRRPEMGLGLLTLAHLQAKRGIVEALETARRAFEALKKSLGSKAPECKEAAQLVEALEEGSDGHAQRRRRA